MQDTENPQRPSPLRGLRTGPDGERFPWGVIDNVHPVGLDVIVEFRRDASRMDQRSAWAEHGRKMFQVWPNGEGRNTRTYFSFYEAVLGAVAVRHDGLNTQADRLMARMLRIETES